jgi:signal transduction histidine kinase
MSSVATRYPERVGRVRPVRVVFGVLYVVLGLGFLFDSLHLLAVHSVDLWPLALVGIGTWVFTGRAERAKVEEDRSAQLAVAEERVRIARELHDIVAHSVSLMTIQIAAARRVQQTQPREADEALANAEQTGRRSLSELRSMLSMLRGADASFGAAGHRVNADFEGPARQPLPGLADLDELVKESREAGLDVELRLSGIEPDAAGSVGLAVYRVIQEALTNAIRHAPGAHVQVEVTYAPGFIVLFVDDDGAGTPGGKGSDHRPRADGHGLVGMAERVAAVGGTLDSGPRTPGPGWRVHARIPLLSGQA